MRIAIIGHIMTSFCILTMIFSFNVHAAESRFPLHEAAAKGTLTREQIEQIKANGTINQVDDKNCTLLSWAAGFGRLEQVQALIAAGAAVDTADKDGRTPLNYAAIHGYNKIVEELLRAGASVDKATDRDRTPLIGACSNGHDAAATLLLAAHADVNAAAYDGETPLFAAVLSHSLWHRSIMMIKELLAAGADSGKATFDNHMFPCQTPVQYVVEYGSQELEDFLKRWSRELQPLFRQGLRTACCALLVVHHPRCGARSPASILPPDTNRTICSTILRRGYLLNWQQVGSYIGVALRSLPDGAYVSACTRNYIREEFHQAT